MERGRAAAGAAALTAVLGYALMAGLALGSGASPQQALSLFEVGPEPPPPPPEKLVPHRVHSSRREGAASPPNLRSEPTEVVAPTPVLPVPVPPPVVAAPIAGVGSAPTAGNADIVGPGFGSGGEGNGRGSGGEGDGDGDGGAETPPRRIRGDMRDAPYPPGAAEAGIGGTVSVRYYVETDGHVSDCDVTRSSGSAELDAATCGFIVRRFRFRPALDSRGRPVPSAIIENHSWEVEQVPDEAPQRRRRRFGW